MISKKESYNKLLERFGRAVVYLDDGNIKLDEKEKHVSEFQKILTALSKAIENFEQMGIKMTSQEVLNGFAIKNNN